MHLTLILHTLMSRQATLDCYPNPEYNCRPPQQNPNCSPTDKSRQLLSEIQAVLGGLAKRVECTAGESIKSAFTTLSASVTALIGTTSTEAKDLTNKLEKDVILAVNTSLGVLKALVDKTVKSEFDKLNVAASSAQTLANTKMTATVDFVAKLAEADAALNVKDTQFGLQAKIFSELQTLFDTILAAMGKAQANILIKISQEFSVEKNKLSNEIRRLFKEYNKGLTLIDTKYSAGLRKDIDKTKDKLITELSKLFSSSLTDGGLITMFFSKKLEEFVCLYMKFSA